MTFSSVRMVKYLYLFKVNIKLRKQEVIAFPIPLVYKFAANIVYQRTLVSGLTTKQ